MHPLRFDLRASERPLLGSALGLLHWLLEQPEASEADRAAIRWLGAALRRLPEPVPGRTVEVELTAAEPAVRAYLDAAAEPEEVALAEVLPGLADRAARPTLRLLGSRDVEPPEGRLRTWTVGYHARSLARARLVLAARSYRPGRTLPDAEARAARLDFLLELDELNEHDPALYRRWIEQLHDPGRLRHAGLDLEVCVRADPPMEVDVEAARAVPVAERRGFGLSGCHDDTDFVLVRAPIAEVTPVAAELLGRHAEADVGWRRDDRPGTFVVQYAGHPWTLFVHPHRRNAGRTAKRLSELLLTEVVVVGWGRAAAAEGYTLYDCGERAERYECGPTVWFESHRRPEPTEPLDDPRAVTDAFLRAQDAWLPDWDLLPGVDVAAHLLQPGDLARVDLLVGG